MYKLRYGNSIRPAAYRLHSLTCKSYLLLVALLVAFGGHDCTAMWPMILLTIILLKKVMIMKYIHTLLATAVVLGCTVSNAYAGSGEVRFVGAVTDVTCDLVPKVDGSVDNLIQLGTASMDGKAGLRDFALVLNPAQPDCAALPDDKIATIAWSGLLNENGLANQSGIATDAWVNIKTVNAEGTQKDINSTDHAADFTGATLKSEGAEFTAELNGGKIPGEFSSAAAFVIAYK